MSIISVINQKGGVGKSTLSVHISKALAQKGKKVLMIDLDPQGHLSLAFGVDKDNLEKTLFNIMDIRQEKAADIQDIAIHIDKNLRLVPSNVKLSTLELILANRHGRESRLVHALHPAVKNNYDHIVIDCPPNLGLLTINALVASDNVVVPFDTSIYALDGISYLNNTLEMLKNTINHEIDVRYVLNNFDTRVARNKNMLKTVKAQFNESLFKTVIRKSPHFEEAIRHRSTVFSINKATTAQKDINNLVDEVINWTEKPVKILTISDIRRGTKAKKQSKKKITFQIEAPHASDVKLAGTFNNWDDKNYQLKKVSDCGTWEVTVPLTKGKHHYKFIVDGHWQEDRHNPEKEEVHHGVFNSVLVV